MPEILEGGHERAPLSEVTVGFRGGARCLCATLQVKKIKLGNHWCRECVDIRVRNIGFGVRCSITY